MRYVIKFIKENIRWILLILVLIGVAFLIKQAKEIEPSEIVPWILNQTLRLLGFAN